MCHERFPRFCLVPFVPDRPGSNHRSLAESVSRDRRFPVLLIREHSQSDDGIYGVDHGLVEHSN